MEIDSTSQGREALAGPISAFIPDIRNLKFVATSSHMESASVAMRASYSRYICLWKQVLWR
eukprot:scaffold435153_cov18-Prasinocladus_malaysianus.AAC.2